MMRDVEYPSKEPPSRNYDPNFSTFNENVLQQAIYITQAAMELQERYNSGEKYINYLKTITVGAEKAVMGLKLISRASLIHAENLIRTQLNLLETTDPIRNDFSKLLNIIEKQTTESDEGNADLIGNRDLNNLSEKIKFLEMRQQMKQKESISFGQSSSSRSVNKMDIDEKYPENLSRESLIDLNNVANLPPVPEDIFTSFSIAKPTRSSSLSSLKSMRKVKLFLQKAENSDEDESCSDNDEYGKFLVSKQIYFTNT